MYNIFKEKIKILKYKLTIHESIAPAKLIILQWKTTYSRIFWQHKLILKG